MHQRPNALQILRHRPFLYTALSLFVILYFFWDWEPQETLDLHGNLDAYAFPRKTHARVWDQRAEQVKAAFVHAYNGYEQFAAPHDELKPLTNGFSDHFNGWGVTAVDALDTMLIMKLNAEYGRTLARISKWTFPMAKAKVAPFFETVIRFLGGLLSGYAITQDLVLLELAEELAQKLDPAFEPYGGIFPVFGVNTLDFHVDGPEIGFLAEMASLQIEYLYLAKATGRRRYYDRARNVMDSLASADLRETGGMMPVKWNLTTARPANAHLSIGARADSAHEYLLKQYLLTAKTDNRSLEMYIRTTTHIITDLLYLSPNRRLLYVTETDKKSPEHPARPTHHMDHLSCFLPGLLALGVHTLPLDKLSAIGIDLNLSSPFAKQPSLRDLHLWAANGLAETCYALYADQPTGLAPDQIIIKVAGSTPEVDGGTRWFQEVEKWQKESPGSGTWKGRKRTPPGVGEDLKAVVYTEQERQTGRGRGRDYALRNSGYMLRPETIESLYILYRLTGESRWRNMGWRIFQAIERETRTPSGYASLRTVEVSPGVQEDDMPSYFLAETLKYLYLLFINDDPLPLDRWVFNTEAHPLPVFKWTDKERTDFAIA
ncbi:glycoside hydrolase family 47 protein [Mycena amicta]|nr:glycoside hydrolase family 47 protein [Mycena amicta]